MNGPFEHLLQHIKVLEAQVERDSGLDRRFEELTARLEQRIDDGIEEIETSLGLLIESRSGLFASTVEPFPGKRHEFVERRGLVAFTEPEGAFIRALGLVAEAVLGSVRPP
jgi:hypothetical protein